jgi:hypothetical protein
MMRPKELGGGRRFRPDIIIHRRLSNEENVLVIETKSRAQRGPSDVAKLRELIAEQGAYHYWAGAFIVFHNAPRAVLRSGELRISVRWFVDGGEAYEVFARPVPPTLKEQIAAML